MKLYLTDIKKLSEDKDNNSIKKRWKITGELSLSNEDSATIDFWKAYGGVGTEYVSHLQDTRANVILKDDDVFVINMDVLSSYRDSMPSEYREFSIEVYFTNSNNLKRKYIFTYYITNNDEFILKDTRLHLLQ